MKAIQVKYLPCTNTLGSRLRAFDHDGNSVTVSYDHSLSRNARYDHAALMLCRKMGWSGTLVRGEMGRLTVYVWSNDWDELVVQGGK